MVKVNSVADFVLAVKQGWRQFTGDEPVGGYLLPEVSDSGRGKPLRPRKIYTHPHTGVSFERI